MQLLVACTCILHKNIDTVVHFWKSSNSKTVEILKADKLGARSIDSIKPSDAKEWAVRMKENGYAYQTINNYKRSLKASFYTAIEDDCVRKNPFNYALNTVIEDDRKPRIALTEEQEEKLLSFVESDRTYRKYYDVIVLLLKTGASCFGTMRIDGQ